MDLLLAARWGDTQAIPTHAQKQDKGVSARRTFRGMPDFSNLALVACRVWVSQRYCKFWVLQLVSLTKLGYFVIDKMKRR